MTFLLGVFRVKARFISIVKSLREDLMKSSFGFAEFHALKGQKPSAQGSALGTGRKGGFRPTGAKALNDNAFVLTGRITLPHRKP